MSYKHIYSPFALVEYKDSVNWYNVHSKRAAENFVAAIRKKVFVKILYVTIKVTNISGRPHLKNIPIILSILLMRITNRLLFLLSIIIRNPKNKYIKY